MNMISLIIPTINRMKELGDLLDSIKIQEYKNFEVIIVDQNPPGFLDETIRQYKDIFSLKHIVTFEKGASKARNIGAKAAQGDILFFPDDDSTLRTNTISYAIKKIEKENIDCLFGKTVNEANEDSVINYSKFEDYLNLSNYEGKFVEATMFIKRELFLWYLYDESFGVGTFYGAEEAHDLVLRLLKDNQKLYFDPNLILYHPSKVVNYSDKREIKRVFTYRCGFSHLCVKHKLYKKLIKRIVAVILYIIYLAVFNRKKVRYYFSELLGLMVGITVRS